MGGWRHRGNPEPEGASKRRGARRRGLPLVLALILGVALGGAVGANPALGLLRGTTPKRQAGAGLASSDRSPASGIPAGTVTVHTPAVTIPSTTVTVVRRHKPPPPPPPPPPTTTTEPPEPPPPPTTTTAPPPPPPAPPTTTTTAPPIVIPPHHPRRPVHHRHHYHLVVHHHKAKIVPPPPPAPPKPPHPAPKHLPNAVRVTQGVATPASLRFSVTGITAALIGGAFLILLLAFPAELFNKTYEENEHEIHAAFTAVGLRRHHLPPGVGLIVFVLVGTALTAWLALGEGADGNPVAVGVGLLVALPLVTFAFELPNELYARARSKIPGELHVLPTALAVGLICAFISRAIDLHPAYLYGIFAGFTAARAESLTEEHEGKGVLVGAIILAVVAGLCWWGWAELNAQAHGPHRDWPVILASTAMFWIFILGAEGLVFGLVPLDYLDGSALRRWRGRIWLVAQLLAVAFFIYVLMLHGETEKVNSLSELIKPFAFFMGFGLVSFAFWGYFHWRRRPTARFAGEAAEGIEGIEHPVADEGTPGIIT